MSYTRKNPQENGMGNEIRTQYISALWIITRHCIHKHVIAVYNSEGVNDIPNEGNYIFSPLQMLLCGERDKIRLQKNSCCPTWLGPASIATMSRLQLVFHVQGTSVSILSTEVSCTDTFSWFSLVTSHKDKEST